MKRKILSLMLAAALVLRQAAPALAAGQTVWGEGDSDAEVS